MQEGEEAVERQAAEVTQQLEAAVACAARQQEAARCALQRQQAAAEAALTRQQEAAAAAAAEARAQLAAANGVHLASVHRHLKTVFGWHISYVVSVDLKGSCGAEHHREFKGGGFRV